MENEFLEMFAQCGFYGLEILVRQEEPWQVIDNVEFRSLTVRAFKGKEGPCLEREQAVIYKGPWERVLDDDGHTLCRGQRMAVCDKTYRIMTNPNGPYAKDIIGLEPVDPVALDKAKVFDCQANAIRPASKTKGSKSQRNDGASDDCCSPSCC